MTGVDRCSQCGYMFDPEWLATVPASIEMWCSDACSTAWLDADPKRREGWISLSDLTPERINEEFAKVGLTLPESKPLAPS